MSRAKKASARARSEAGAVAVLTTTLVGLEGVIHGLAAGVRDNTARLNRAVDALSLRMDAVERREADRTFVKPEPNPMCDTSRLAASATVPPLEIGAVQAKSQVAEGGNCHRVTFGGVTLDKPAPEKLEVGGANAIRGAEVDRLLEETQPWYESGRGVDPERRVPIEPGSIERLNKALNGKYSVYEADAMDHPVMLILSEVVALRKRLDQNERLIRFLVERSASPR